MRYLHKKRNRKIKEPSWKYSHWEIYGLGKQPGKSAVAPNCPNPECLIRDVQEVRWMVDDP